MSERVIVITGGASGLGKCCAKTFAAQGDTVAIVDINPQLSQQTVEEIEREGGKAAFFIGDITSKSASLELLNGIIEKFGDVSVLVNCAGVYPRKPILEIEDADWELECAVNIRGTYNMMAVVVKHFLATSTGADVNGRIVNVASVDAFKAHPQNAHYAATKAAVVSLTKSFAAEFASSQILINGVAPAGIATDRAKELGFLPELTAASPLGRAAEPQDITDVIIFLAGDKNRYMTGETTIVSGGYIYA
ncbi:SDR family NAD(P)-dependent oxidoreductase [Marinomonas communis]|uniref:NAD(P)-dependent dehydrogenase (Short-subunit alcohol dehydrogenase family) n=1 Tax=Marinomonas communis TaxID=28254 RepID=A0A4R6X6Y6_9GAMM|nr:SDR family NAD(P)-dependent oxidoreductase [Marinomonas communis]TDR12483.1 NAD(P)-dependent dehydrogenase (short-subunit alcohol dehydrogenase family) [Marinomonas communis]